LTAKGAFITVVMQHIGRVSVRRIIKECYKTEEEEKE
jgi:hypothetical protein